MTNFEEKFSGHVIELMPTVKSLWSKPESKDL